MGEPAGHYFDATPSSRSAPKEVRLDLPDLSIRLSTDRGVFSPDRVDAGTKLLLLEGPPPTTRGTLVDLGCGYGAIACTLARRSPNTTVWAVDVNQRALDLCRANVERLELTNVQVVPVAEVPGDLEVDELWSNPPIRIGKAALHELLLSWLERLTPDGRARLVVQKHLGADSLHRWLEAEGWAVERLTSRGGYRLLEVRHPVKQLDGTGMKRLHREWRRRTEGRLALVLDDVQGPFNVGAIIRTAAALRVEDVWLAGRTPEPDDTKVGKTALGTQRYLTFQRADTTAAAIDAARARGYRVVGLELADDAVPLHEVTPAEATCIVVGHEDRGCSPATLEACDAVAYVPLLGKVGSLNVATATAIALYELRRQHWHDPTG